MEGRAQRKRATATSSFGVSRRENHDASGFYARFTAPELSADATVEPPGVVDEIYVGRLPPHGPGPPVVGGPRRHLAAVLRRQGLRGGSGRGSHPRHLRRVPHDARGRVRRVRRPSSSRAAASRSTWPTSAASPTARLSADVIGILQDRLGLLLRGEVIWRKARGRRRELRVGLVQEAGQPGAARPHRAGGDRQQGPLRPRRRSGHTGPAGACPRCRSTTADEFMDATLDLWEMAPESANRVGHPAPFPVELPQRLIDLYTYRATSSSTRSWARAPPPWPRCAPGATTRLRHRRGLRPRRPGPGGRGGGARRRLAHRRARGPARQGQRRGARPAGRRRLRRCRRQGLEASAVRRRARRRLDRHRRARARSGWCSSRGEHGRALGPAPLGGAVPHARRGVGPRPPPAIASWSSPPTCPRPGRLRSAPCAPHAAGPGRRARARRPGGGGAAVGVRGRRRPTVRSATSCPAPDRRPLRAVRQDRDHRDRHRLRDHGGGLARDALGPQVVANVDPAVWDRLAGLHGEGQHRQEFAAAWANGQAFLAGRPRACGVRTAAGRVEGPRPRHPATRSCPRTSGWTTCG